MVQKFGSKLKVKGLRLGDDSMRTRKNISLGPYEMVTGVGRIRTAPGAGGGEIILAVRIPIQVRRTPVVSFAVIAAFTKPLA